MPPPRLVRLALRLAPVLLVVQSPTAAHARQSPERGAALAAEMGCGACHAGAPDPGPARTRAPRLDPAAPALPADFVFAWLADPTPRREGLGATRMPDFSLDEAERAALALFLGSGAPGPALEAARRRHPAADAERGRRIYGVLGCAGCHEGVQGAGPIEAPDLSREGVRVLPEWLTAWLRTPTPLRGPAHAAAPGARMPDFRLTEAEAAALAAWLDGLGSRFAVLEGPPLSAIQEGRARAYLEGRASCLGCHEVGGVGGRIGPSLDALGRRLQPSFVLEMILDPARAAPGSPMPHQPMPRGEAERLARHLLAASGSGSATSAAAQTRSLAEPDHPAWSTLDGAGTGAALYARHCAACHGPTGQGDGWNAPSLPVPPTRHADAALMSARIDDALHDAIHAGGWVLDRSPRMPAFGELLTPDEIRTLVQHVRTLCACEPPAWSRDGARGGAR